MERLKKILLFSLEGTGERATLARAVELAKRNRARLTLVEVVEELPREVPMLITALAPADVRVGGLEVLGKSPGLLQPLHPPLFYAIDCSLDSALIPAPASPSAARASTARPEPSCARTAPPSPDSSPRAAKSSASRPARGSAVDARVSRAR